MKKRFRLKGEVCLEKDGQLVINLTTDECEGISFQEGDKVIVEGDFDEF